VSGGKMTNGLILLPPINSMAFQIAPQFIMGLRRSHSSFVIRHSFLFVTLLLLLCGTVHAQETGGVSGVVVSSWDGSLLSGATVTVRGTTLAAQTDSTGKYQLSSVPAGEQVLRFSKSSYAAVVVTDVRVIPGQTTTVNGNLRPEFYEMEEFEVTAEEFTQQTEQINFERQSSSGLMDAIGSEQFSKLGVDDAAGALGKVSGASVADGKFAVIRGLADRYTTTTMNGGDVPSADPNRKAAQLDLFPSQFISQVNVRKTFTPDMPGGFSGGAIDIVTRSFPTDGFFAMSVGGTYNSQSSLRDDFLYSDQGATDWLAMDDGTRALPALAAGTGPVGTVSQLNPAIKDSFGSRQFSGIPGKSPLGSSFSLAFGDSGKLFGKKVGFLAGLSYKTDYQHYSDGLVAKPVDTRFGLQYDTLYSDTRSTIEYTLGAQMTFAMELSEQHKLTFNYLKVQTAEDDVRQTRGQNATLSTEPGVSYVEQDTLFWTERSLDYFQLLGGHEFPDLLGSRFDWGGTMSATTQDEPDHRIFQFFAQPDAPFYGPDGPSQPSRPTRIFRNLQEDNVSARGDVTIPIFESSARDHFLKAGTAMSKSERIYDSRIFDIRLNSFGHPFVSSGNPQDFLDPAYQNLIAYYNFPANFAYTGEQKIGAYYGMADVAPLDWLRLIGGARFESTDIEVKTRNLSQGTAPSTSSLKQNDILPSLGAVFSIQTNLLLRASWSRTVVRPAYHEISRAEIFDVAQGRTLYGNPGLKISSSENVDLRLEWFPRAGELISLSVFNKKIADPIELGSLDLNNETVSYNNFEKADVNGFEIELRKELGTLWKPLEEFTLGLNYSQIFSEVPLTADQIFNRAYFSSETTRPMYDQPEFIFNTDLTWDHKDTGTALTLSGGIVGRRLVTVGLALPDEYEEPAPQVDIFLSQKLGRHWKVKFSAKNLLDPAIETTITWPRAGVTPIKSYTKGISYGLTVSCEF
jgi:outer membrane receptor protein involved in Fe transport